MTEYTLQITEDEAIVLFEFFERFGDTAKLEFEHAAEYVAIMRLSGQIDKTTAAMFDPEYARLLSEARKRIAEGFEGEVPGMKQHGQLWKDKEH
jgi:hypothetical protein